MPAIIRRKVVTVPGDHMIMVSFLPGHSDLSFPALPDPHALPGGAGLYPTIHSVLKGLKLSFRIVAVIILIEPAVRFSELNFVNTNKINFASNNILAEESFHVQKPRLIYFQ